MFINSITEESISKALFEMKVLSNEVVTVYVAEKNKDEIDNIRQILIRNEVRFCGAFFPGLIYQNMHKTEGLILQKHRCDSDFLMVENIMDFNFEKDIKAEIPYEKIESVVVLLDGLASGNANFMRKLNGELNMHVAFIGGGAGSLSLQQEPCLFDKNGVYMNAALLLLTQQKCRVDVQHGWQKLIGPLVVTESEKNIIKEINWRNALEVYKEIVEQDFPHKFQQHNFFEISINYPLGISRENNEPIVRVPISVDANGFLKCIGEVPENAVLDILKGDKDELINAAKKAAFNVCNNWGNTIPNNSLVINCVARSLFMGDKFSEELSQIDNQLKLLNENIQTEGILTLGEISSQEGTIVEFYNKTVVIGIFE